MPIKKTVKKSVEEIAYEKQLQKIVGDKFIFTEIRKLPSGNWKVAGHTTSDVTFTPSKLAEFVKTIQKTCIKAKFTISIN